MKSTVFSIGNCPELATLRKMSFFCVKRTIFVRFVNFRLKTLLILAKPNAVANFQFCRNPNFVIRIST